MKRVLLVLAAILFLAGTAQADIIAYTGFEEPADSSGRYALTGTEGEALPTSSSATTSYTGGTELGFETYLVSGSGPLGSDETSGDWIGITDYFAYNGQSYEIEDADDEVTLVLETVDLTGWTDVTVSAYVQVCLSTSYTDYETEDNISVYVETDLGTTYLADWDGDALDTLIADGYVWYAISADISDDSTWATFVLDVATNGSNEGAKLDDVYFEGTFAPVPVPAAVWLLGSGLVGLIGIRRKKA
jgi:hypothetical protein